MVDWHRIQYNGVHWINEDIRVTGQVDVLADGKDEALSSYNTFKAIRAHSKAAGSPINLREPIDIKWCGHSDGSRAPDIDPREQDDGGQEEFQFKGDKL